MLYLSGEDVTRLLDPDTAIQSQRDAFAALATGAVDLPDKIMYPSRSDDSVMFCYAAKLSALSGTVTKVGTIYPGNTAKGLPSVHAVVTVFDADSGAPVAVMDGTAVTTLRTAAGSAVAVDLLATPDADELGILGAGVQARAHARAIARVRRLRAIRVWSPSQQRRAAVATDLADELGIPARAVDTAEQAVDGAPIVAACTLSHEPVVRGAWLAAGSTVISIGSFEPHRSEVDADVVARSAAVVVDDPATAAGHAGPIVTAIGAGTLDRTDLVALGDVLVGRHAGRSGADDVVYYNSTGIGVQDAAAAWSVVTAARAAAAAE